MDNVDLFQEVKDENLPFTEAAEITLKSEKEDEPIKKSNKKDKIFKIQIILIIMWLVLTVLIYFFGYPIFEKFIKVD